MALDTLVPIGRVKRDISDLVNRVAYQAVQVHGGYGYMEEYRICRIYRDVRGLSIFAGTSEIMKLINLERNTYLNTNSTNAEDLYPP